LFEDGVDHQFFSFRKREVPVEKLKIIWVGSRFHGEAIKGYELVASAMDACSSFVDFSYVENTPFDKMPEVYRQADVVVIGSRVEGTPNPFLEMCSTGGVYIATPVGVIPDFHKQAQGGFLVPERTKQGFIFAVTQLYSNRSKLPEWGERNREEILRNWTWASKFQQLDAIIKPLLQNNTTHATLSSRYKIPIKSRIQGN